MSEIKVRRNDDPPSLIIEWDNRAIHRQPALSCILPTFWGLWTAATLIATWYFFGDIDGPDLFIFGIAYFVALVLPFTWILRYTKERIEITPHEFQHRYLRFPWFNPIRCPMSSLTSVQIGHYVNEIGDIDAVVTLRVCAGNKGTLIAYWADDALKYRIFQEIDDFLAAIGSSIERLDRYEIEDMRESSASR